MGIGLGDILGSISPAYGVFTGKGLGGLARYLSPAFDIATLLGGHGNGQAAPSQPQLPMQSNGLGAILAQILGTM